MTDSYGKQNHRSAKRPIPGTSADSFARRMARSREALDSAGTTSADAFAGHATAKSFSGLSTEHLCAGYGKRQILKELSFRAEAGTLTGLLGANGCGKTTLLKVLCQQLPHSGSCFYDGQPLEKLSTRELALRISYIPQRSGITLSLSALDVVLMGVNPRLGFLENPSRAHEAQAYEALSLLGMESYADTDYQKLSEGQKQLCILARTLVEDAPLLLLDEPESSLDFAQRHRMMRLLASLITPPRLGDASGSAAISPHCPGDASDPAIILSPCLGGASDPAIISPPCLGGASDSVSGSGNPAAARSPGVKTSSSPSASEAHRILKTALVTLHDPVLALEYCQTLVLLKDGTCTATLHPATDALASMESALSDLYGPVSLRDLGENGKRRLVLLPHA